MITALHAQVVETPARNTCARAATILLLYFYFYFYFYDYDDDDV